MADDQEYLDELKARRRAMAGVRQTSFEQQSTTFDQESLDKEIARVERIVASAPRVRFASVSKGV